MVCLAITFYNYFLTKIKFKKPTLSIVPSKIEVLYINYFNSINIQCHFGPSLKLTRLELNVAPLWVCEVLHPGANVIKLFTVVRYDFS
jgi:hypothetical protein